MKKNKFIIIALLFLLIFNSPVFSAADFDYSNTYCLITGVLSWPDKGYASFSTKNRKDVELYDTLIRKGVKKENSILLIDNEATLSNIKESLKKISQKAPGNANLIFYYAGHGVKTKDGNSYFTNYDIKGDEEAATGLNVSDIASIIKENFKGKLVILMADCCYSGALCPQAQTLTRNGINTIALTSASSSNSSTGSWAFTQSVIDGLEGNSLYDHNLDNNITLSEVKNEIYNAMKYREHQKCGVFLPQNTENIKISSKNNTGYSYGKPCGSFNAGDYVFGFYTNKWESARILDYKNNAYVAEFYFYSDKEIKNLPEGKIKKEYFVKLKKNANYIVEWKKQGYNAKILEAADVFYYITYPGYTNYWDEWITYDRVLFEAMPEYKKVMALYENKWYPAVILTSDDKDNYFIHYPGFDYTWDEWVNSSKINR